MERFVSRFNRLAYQALSRFDASKWPKVTLIHGRNGLGKSTILRDLYEKVLSQRPGDRPLYLSAAAFATRYAIAAQEGRLGNFRQGIRSSAFLFLDDIQDLRGKEKTIEELFYTFEHIMEQNGKVVVVLEAEEVNLLFLGERLASRFLSGLTLGLDQPEANELKHFAEYYLQKRLAILEPGLAEGIAESSSTLRTVKERTEEFLSYLTRKHGSATAAEFGTYWQVRQKELRLAPSPENILSFVSELSGISVSDILGRRRLPEIIEARHLSMYAVKVICQSSYADMSRFFKKEHGAVMAVCKSFEAKLNANSGLSVRLDMILSHFLQEPQM